MTGPTPSDPNAGPPSAPPPPGAPPPPPSGPVTPPPPPAPPVSAYPNTGWAPPPGQVPTGYPAPYPSPYGAPPSGTVPAPKRSGRGRLLAFGAIALSVILVSVLVIVWPRGGKDAGPSASAGANATKTPVQTTAPGSTAPGVTTVPSAGPKVLKIGISLPLSGSALASAGPARDGALLAIKGFHLEGYTIEPVILDHAFNGVHDPQQGAIDMTNLVADPEVMAVVGPFNSSVAKVQIPISNEAGLLQCSPSNTNPAITKGETGRELRAANPDKINYVRVSTSDDWQGAAVARFALDDLGVQRVAIIDDTETYGAGLADAFAATWEQLGGVVVDRESASVETVDYTSILTSFASSNPDAVFFGGVTATGGATIRQQMAAAGLDPAKVAYLGGDGIQDGPGSVDGSFINIAGRDAANSYTSVAAIAEFPGQALFDAKYHEAYGVAPGAYSAPGDACAEVILQAIATAAAKGEVTREAVRAAGSDTATTFDTVLGPVAFDAVGDITTRTISIYQVDMAAGNGAGDWTYRKQIVLP